MTIVERTSVAVFGLLLACIFGVLLAWMVMAVAVGTDDKSKTGTSAEKIEILRVHPLPPSAPDRFMLIGGRGTDEREGYWTDPESGEQVKFSKAARFQSQSHGLTSCWQVKTIRVSGSKAVEGEFA